MIKNKLQIGNIPAVIWGNKSDKIFMAIHGNMSNKEDTIIQLFADEACKAGYQILSFDLPEHGDRKEEGLPCKIQFCIRDLKEIMDYAKGNWKKIDLFACSMGVYFALMSYANEELGKSLFLSPVVDMESVIDSMMSTFDVTPEILKEKKVVETPIGLTLYWDYYSYVKTHPVTMWNSKTSILYGAKDKLSHYDVIDKFVKKFKCHLEVAVSAEHYFHTEEQLNTFKTWLKSNIYS